MIAAQHLDACRVVLRQAIDNLPAKCREAYRAASPATLQAVLMTANLQREAMPYKLDDLSLIEQRAVGRAAARLALKRFGPLRPEFEALSILGLQ